MVIAVNIITVLIVFIIAIFCIVFTPLFEDWSLQFSSTIIIAVIVIVFVTVIFDDKITPSHHL